MRTGYVCFLTNRPNGILYVGVTSNLARRIYEHRIGAVAGFTKRYALKRLVYFESFDDIQTAIQREHNIKHWNRAWKVRLILAAIPTGMICSKRFGQKAWMAVTSPRLSG
jgi:putative endonuclease